MTDDTQLEADLFEALRAVPDEGHREKLIDAACSGKPKLRQRIQDLLKAADGAGSFMDQPAAQFDETAEPIVLTEKPGAVIGRYKLLEQIGEGGFGVVYMADQLRPIERRVALKIIKLGMDTKQVIARFEAERQALALMDHPNIAKILDAGTTETGRPYFVMELVRGIPVTEYCNDRGLTTDQRLRLFAQICSAVQHAHQKGIIHRDIKPSNILVATNGDEAVPKVIDFGIAKATQGRLTDKTLFTQFRQFIGTPAYMSPEQAQMSAVDVDTRSDIYSLGVLLYELLTGQTPLDLFDLAKAGYEEICRRIREEEAIKPSKRLSSLHHDKLSTLAKQRKSAPSQFTASIRGDLDWIVMRAVEKDRSRRYDSCSALASDIGRYLSNQPVAAGPPSVLYHLRKFVQRNRVAALTTFAIAASLLIGTTLATTGMLRANREKVNADRANASLTKQIQETNQERDKVAASAARAVAAEAKVVRSLYVAEMLKAKHEFDAENTQVSIDILNKYIPRDGSPDLRGWEWRWLWNQCHQETFVLTGHTGPIRDLRFAADGRRIVSGSTDGSVRIWDVQSGTETWKFERPDTAYRNDCNRVDFSPDGERLLTAWWPRGPNGNRTILFDVSDPYSGKEVRRLKNGGDRFSLDGTTLFTLGGTQRSLTDELVDEVHTDGIYGRHLSRSQQTIVTNDSIWDVATKKELGKLPDHKGFIDVPAGENAAVSPIDENIVVTAYVKGAFVWDRAGNLIRKLEGTGGTPMSGVDFSADGKHLAVRNALGAVYVFETDSWAHVLTFPTKAGSNTVFSPTDENLLVTGDMDGTIHGWNISPDRLQDAVFEHPDEIINLRFSPDNKVLAAGMQYGVVYFWDVATRRLLFKSPKHDEKLGRFLNSYSCDFVDFSADSRYAAIIGPSTDLSIWDVLTGKRVQHFQPRGGNDLGEIKYNSVEFAPNGRQLYAGWCVSEVWLELYPEEKTQLARLEKWEFANGIAQEPSSHKEFPARKAVLSSVDISADGKLLTSVSSDDVFAWNLSESTPTAVRVTDERFAWNLRLSNTGKRLAIAIEPPGVVVMNIADWSRKFTLRHSNGTTHISWFPDDSRLVASDISATTHVWHVATQQIVTSFRGTVAEFSPDGTILAVGGQGSKFIDDEEHVGRVTLHYAPPLEEIDRRRLKDEQE